MAMSHVLFVTTSASDVQQITVKSTAFTHMGRIPQKYTANGSNISPELSFSKLPDGTKSLVVIMEDPHAPIDTWVHWLMWNVPPVNKINEGTAPGLQGINAFQGYHYQGPCPPANTRHYFFKIYALNTLLPLPRNSTKYDVVKAMKDHVLGYGELIGSYNRNHTSSIHSHSAPDIYA